MIQTAFVMSSGGISFANSSEPKISLSPVVDEQQHSQAKYVYDVVIHDPKDMEMLLDRIETLSNSTPHEENHPGLALVLHGPEIEFFTRSNYPKYMKLVNRAEALDRKGIIDVKVCDTMIRELNIDELDLPGFVDHVPYVPAEVERLVKQGYIRM